MNLSKNESDEQDVDLDKDCWKIIDEYFGQTKNITLMNHQLESFNDFISIKIPDIVKQYNPINVYHEYSEQHNMYKKEIIIHFNDVYIICNDRCLSHDIGSVGIVNTIVILRTENAIKVTVFK